MCISLYSALQIEIYFTIPEANVRRGVKPYVIRSVGMSRCQKSLSVCRSLCLHVYLFVCLRQRNLRFQLIKSIKQYETNKQAHQKRFISYVFQSQPARSHNDRKLAEWSFSSFCCCCCCFCFCLFGFMSCCFFNMYWVFSSHDGKGDVFAVFFFLFFIHYTLSSCVGDLTDAVGTLCPIKRKALTERWRRPREWVHFSAMSAQKKYLFHTKFTAVANLVTINSFAMDRENTTETIHRRIIQFLTCLTPTRKHQKPREIFFESIHCWVTMKHRTAFW